MTRLPSPVRYVPYAELGARPNIIVDGAALKSTVLTLSHWPNNSTPDSLKRDTSTATVFAYLDTPRLHCAAPIVSNNHFDEDGLFSMFALQDPALALRHRALLTDASFAGDFGRYRTREAARLCFVIEAHADPKLSPFPRQTFSASPSDRVRRLYRRMLPLLARVLKNPHAYRRFWELQDEHLRASEALVASGQVVIEEEPELDLAIIRIPPGIPPCTAWLYLRRERSAIHPFAIHNATRCTRLVRVQGRRIELRYRYESWLQIPSRRPAPRVDLTPFRVWLNRHDRGGWIWEDTLDIAPRLYRRDGLPCRLSPEAFLRALREFLTSLPPVWDAYGWSVRCR